MSKHSHGHWVVGADWDSDGNARYTLIGCKKFCAPDARLIAAAPDLLEALRQALPLLQEVSDAEGYASTTAHRALAAARSAIAKSEIEL